MFAAQRPAFAGFFPLLLAYSLTYMPTIALTGTITLPTSRMWSVIPAHSCDGPYRLDCLRSGMWFLAANTGVCRYLTD
ncbi:hypothetical protein ACLBOM_15215 [Escherichia coli]